MPVGSGRGGQRKKYDKASFYRSGAKTNPVQAECCGLGAAERVLLFSINLRKQNVRSYEIWLAQNGSHFKLACVECWRCSCSRQHHAANQQSLLARLWACLSAWRSADA